jgi:hypothetical protein
VTFVKHYLLIGLFAGMLLGSWVLEGTVLRGKSALFGVVEKKPWPDFELSTVLDGTYQKAAEDSFRQSAPLRTFWIRLFNQFRLSIFGIWPNENVIVGKDDYLFEAAYIQDYLRLAPFDVPTIDATLKDIVRISSTLEKSGRKLVVVITPSKADFYPETIPDSFKTGQPITSKRGYEVLQAGLTNAGIPTFDAANYLWQNKSEIVGPVYMRSGTHWSWMAVATATKGFVDYLNQMGLGLPVIETISAKAVWPPQNPDADLLLLMNTLDFLVREPFRSDTYYYPEVKVSGSGTKSSFFIQGGSFTENLVRILSEAKIVSTPYWLANNRIFNETTKKGDFSKFSELDFHQILQAKIIVLEVNRQAAYHMGFGFISELRNYLDANPNLPPPGLANGL